MKSCDFRISQMEWLHIEGMLRVEQTSKENFWNKEIFREQLKGRFSGRDGYVATLEDKIVGFVALENVGGCGHVLNMVVSKKFRRKGVGTFLLSTLTERIPDRFDLLKINVRESNLAAQLFLKKLGFWCGSISRNYFMDQSHNGWKCEDAYCFDFDPSVRREINNPFLLTDRFGSILTKVHSRQKDSLFQNCN